MVTSVENKLVLLRKQLASLERKALAQKRTRLRALRKLPAKYGYSDLDSFISDLKESNKSGPPTKRRTRGKVTAEVREKIKEMTKQGMTAAKIANVVRVSVASVAKAKKELGLTRVRKNHRN